MDSFPYFLDMFLDRSFFFSCVFYVASSRSLPEIAPERSSVSALKRASLLRFFSVSRRLGECQKRIEKGGPVPRPSARSAMLRLTARCAV